MQIFSSNHYQLMFFFLETWDGEFQPAFILSAGAKQDYPSRLGLAKSLVNIIE